MFSKNKTDWSLLAKSLAGETNEKEMQAITEWLSKSPENRALYKQIKSDWKRMDTMNKQFNVDNAWSKLHDRIVANEVPAISIDNSLRRVRPYQFLLTPIRIAASIMLLAILGTSGVYFANRLQKVNVTADINERGKSIILPDGSSVYLNANSSISYSKHFITRSREVKLKGEAFFEVSPNKTKPFRIFANNACIKVLGTSFNVKASRNDNRVSVYVSSGIVELSKADAINNGMLLKPGDIGLLNNQEITAMKAENENCIAWKTGSLSFRDTKLLEVTSLLNDIYHVKIVLREAGLDTTRINGDYRNDPLDDILKVICKQTHLTVEKSDDMIYLLR
jgi:ferric-dicitrate binding protein FerR (iron transport regulator)